MIPSVIPRSVRLQCSLAAILADPSSLVERDLLGISPWGPDELEPFRTAPHGRLIAHAIAVDLGLLSLGAEETLAVGLRTREDVRLALQISIAPVADLRVGVRQLAAAVFRKSIGKAVRKSDRLMLLEFLGEDALFTAARQAETFWPSLSVFDMLDPALITRPAALSQPEATDANDPTIVGVAWTRPVLAREIAELPAILRQAWGVLHACVDATDKTSGAILRARFGTGIAGLFPATAALGRSAMVHPLPPAQRAVIFNLLQRKVPAWSTSID